MGRLKLFLLISAKGLQHNADFFCNALSLSLEMISWLHGIFSVLSVGVQSINYLGQGSKPACNESFLFAVTGDVSHLHLKIIDKDTFTDDDYVGEANISLEPVFIEGIAPATAFNVVNKDHEYHGEIKIGFNFTPEPEKNCFCARDNAGIEESYGGWK